MTIEPKDHLAVCDTVYAYATAVDSRDWELYRSIVAPELSVDFSSFNGHPPSRAAADVWIEGVRNRLSGLVTHHSMTNPRVEVEGNTAVCTMYMHAVHVLDGEPDAWFDVGGYYRDELVRVDDGWLLSAIALTVLWKRGREDVMAIARERSGAQPWV